MSSLKAETAALTGNEFVQTLIDLVKAFERVPHHVLVAFAIKWDYNLGMLRLSIAAYRLKRRIVIDGVCSRTITATRGITAGAGHATSELRLFMLDLITTSTAAFPFVTQTLYVDDLTLEADGPADIAPKQLAAASDHAVQYLERHLSAEVSPTKTVSIASSSKASRVLQQHLRSKKIKKAQSSKALGVQTAGGKRRRTSTLRQRLATFRSKVSRIQKLRAAGLNATLITKSAGTSSFFYGVHCIGVSNSHLEASCRTYASAVSTGTGGKQLDRIMLVDTAAGYWGDPAYDAHVQPLQYLSMAWWEAWAPPAALREGSVMAIRKLAAASGSVWTLVNGPLTAAVATAHRLKWRFRSPCILETDTTRLLDLRKDPPAVVAKQVRLAVMRWRTARLIKQLPGLLPPAPVASGNPGKYMHSRLLRSHVVGQNPAPSNLLRPKHSVPKAIADLWSRDDRPWLKSAAVGAQWPQARVAAVPGWTDDASCQLCGCVNGTLEHRVHCPANVPPAGWSAPSAEAQEGLSMLTQSQKRLLYGTGLMIMRIKIPGPPQQENFQWLVELPDDTDLSTIRWYIDGSLIDPSTPFLRLGAGLVGVCGSRPVALAIAVPPPWIDTIPGAEAWALFCIMAASHSLPSVMTDCLGNLRTLLEGREAATSAKRPLARVWAAIFSCCDEATPEQIGQVLTWGPAHTSLATLGSRLRSDGKPLTAVDWRANALADAAAKMAAHSVRAPWLVRHTYKCLICMALLLLALLVAPLIITLRCNRRRTVPSSG